MRHVFWRKWLRRTFGLARTAPIRRTAPPRLEGLEARWAPAITGTTPTTISPTEGTLFNDSVGTFTTDTPGDTFTATINWGDGTTDAGTVAFTGSTGTVTGSHTYADEFNNLPVNVTVVESGASPDTATINSTANVAEADSLSGTASTRVGTSRLASPASSGR